MAWIDLIRSIFNFDLQEDKTVILRPWDATSTLVSFASPKDLPDASNDALWKKYAGGLGTISFGHNIWSSVHWGYSVDHESFQWPGKHKDLFESQSIGAYPHVIHDSDKEVDLGYWTWQQNVDTLPYGFKLKPIPKLKDTVPPRKDD